MDRKNSIDTRNISYTPYFKKKTIEDNVDFDKRLALDNDYFKSQIKEGYITEGDFIKLKRKAQKIIERQKKGIFSSVTANAEVEKLKCEYMELRKNILVRSGIDQSKEKLVVDALENIYGFYGINKHTYRNSMMKRFFKGIFDGIVGGNYELALKIKKSSLSEIGKMFGSILTVEGLYMIIKGLGMNVSDLIRGDSYEKGKSLAELGVIAIGSGVAGAMLKGTGKLIINASLRTGGRTSKALGMAGKAIEKTGNIVQSPYNRTNLAIERSIGVGFSGIKKAVAIIGIEKGAELLRKKLISGNIAKIHEELHPQELEEILNKSSEGMRLSREENLKLAAQIERNNPIFKILKTLKKGDDFQMIFFSKLKKLNDNVSQVFADMVLNDFKRKVCMKYPGINIVWDNYNSFTFKVPRNVKIDNKFLEEEMMKSFESISHKEGIRLDAGEYCPKISSRRGKVVGKTQEDILHSIAKVRSELEGESIGRKVLNIDELNIKEKEIFSKYSFGSNINETFTDIVNGNTYSTRGGYLEIKHIQDGKLVKDRFLIFGSGNEISTKIITMVRKGDLPANMSLYKDIRELLDGIIVNGEFILPHIISKDGIKNGKFISRTKIREHERFVEAVKRGEVKDVKKLKDLTENTYKGALTKDMLYHKVNGPGVAFFIDIRDLGSHNMKDILRNINKNGNILESANSITNDFMKIFTNLRNNLERKYPGYEICMSLGGDEIKFFMKGAPENLLKPISEDIFTSIGSSDILKGRITGSHISKKDVAIGGKDIFEGLDKMTQVSKVIEKRLSAIEENIFFQHRLGTDVSDKKRMYNEIKDFSILKKGDKDYIVFQNGSLKGDMIELGKVVESIKGKIQLKPYDNPFIDFLDDAGLGRSTERKISVNQ
ncbi:MAG: hypothetical protein PHS92_00675 [Candidatus Gracilibacteria bacterium]|nr:hypothetical protein [Candidatus Gracilibacteria bacterium]